MKSFLLATLAMTASALAVEKHTRPEFPRIYPDNFTPNPEWPPLDYTRVDGPDDCEEGTVFNQRACACFQEGKCQTRCEFPFTKNPFACGGCITVIEHRGIFTHDHVCTVEDTQEPAQKEPSIRPYKVPRV